MFVRAEVKRRIKLRKNKKLKKTQKTEIMCKR